MKRTLKFAAMLLAVVAVVATGCHKENNGDDNGGGNGGGGNAPTPTVTTYTVTFNANGGTGTMQPQTFTEGETKALTANAFTYQYHTFMNWNTDADGTGTAYTDGQETSLTQNVTLYAQWQHITYTVTFDANGGTGEMAAQTFNAGEAQALAVNVFSRDNYWFLGWNSSSDGSGTSYSDKQNLTLTENITLYAKWSLGVTGNTTGHNYVDLGLPSGTLWATTNVGADNPIAYGDHFAWGETQPQASNTYNWSSYKYCNGSYNSLTKYCNNASYGNNGFTDTLTVLLPEDDAATVNWGNGWRMPTQTELRELKDNCTITWTTQNGVNGRLFTAANGNSVFLPAAGYRWVGGLSNDGSYGDYWSSSLNAVSPSHAWFLYFFSGNYGMDDGNRTLGFSVRPVCASH